MWTANYFAPRYFAPRYWAKIGEDGPEPEAATALISRTWVGIGVAVILLILVHTKWP